MSDESKKTDADDNIDTEVKSETTKKPAAARKKIKAKSNDNTEKDAPKKKIIEKLQAMGVMSGGKTNTATSNDDPEKGRLPKILIASVVVVLVAGSFVWALNKEAANEQVASSANNQVIPSAYPGAWQPSAVNSQNNNSGYRAFDNGMQQQRVQQQREQQKKWMQQQQQAQEQQRAQQQKWAQQWQQAQEQQRAQQQKWAQQPPTQEQYRTQQQKWAQQQQQAQEQQRAQQQKWAQQQQQIREQQWAQQQKWAEQQRARQPYYAYPPNTGYQGQSMPPSYNYAPAYQQSSPYYGRQY